VETQLKAWFGNWQRELEGAYLYGELAHLAKGASLKKALAQMADQEQEHSQVWAAQVRSQVADAETPHIDLRIRLTLLMARMFGVRAVLPLLMNDEVSDITSYMRQATQSADLLPTYRKVVRDETTHARALDRLRHPGEPDQEEPWHKGAVASSMVRSMVYGFNDGLTANFGLVMGVVGAAVNNQIILLTGFAGLMADALSMAASGFLAARSQQEVREYDLALEKAELELMPEQEKEELTGFYSAKGLTRGEAAQVAEKIMQNPDTALSTLAREELGIDPQDPSNPLQEGIVTGIATGLGAIIPILPFLFWSGQAAVWGGVAISMVAHFLVGAGRSIFTGRPAFRSGIEMFVVGMGVALFTYFLGQLIGLKL
jgi:VIT1/CCC1 family predicted Fe2+/Mn2+ transporter